MAMQCAVGYSENIDESNEAGLEIGDMVLQKIKLQDHSIGILFCHIDFDFAELLRGIKEKLDIPIIGCTTATEANDQGYFEESASLLVVTDDDLKIGLGLGQGLSKNPEDAVRKACAAAKSMLGGDTPKLALTFPDTFLNLSTDLILNLLEENLDKDMPVVGALPGDNFMFKKTYQFFGDHAYSDSIPLLLLSGNIEPLIITRGGWLPLGKKVKVTKAVDNRLYEIDHRPAIEYFKQYIPNVDDPDVMGTYPVALLDDSLGSDAGKYCVIRAGFTYNKEDGSLNCTGYIPENTTIQLSRGTRDDILAGSKEAITTLVKRAENKTLHALLCFSCAGRKLNLGLETKKEIELILNELPADCAMNGFYSYGEIGPIDNTMEKLRKNRFHNTTLVLCAF